jgi:hypothetical protein
LTHTDLSCPINFSLSIRTLLERLFLLSYPPLFSSSLLHFNIGRLVMLLPDTSAPQNPRGTRWNYISVTLTALTSELHLPTQTPSPPTAESPAEASNGMSGRRGLMNTESAHSLLLHCRRNLATLKGFIKGAFPTSHIYPALICPTLFYLTLFTSVRFTV